MNHSPSSILSLPSAASPSSTHPAYTAYELFLAAGNLDRAHDIAVLSLAPDAVIRNDWALLKELFSPFVPFSGDNDRGRVEGWYVRGKVCDFYYIYRLLYPALILVLSGFS